MTLMFIFRMIALLCAIISVQNSFAQQTPDKVYGALFTAVQEKAVFSDSKTFVDCIPKKSPSAIVADYNAQHKNKNFDLAKFVHKNFTVQPQPNVINIKKGKPIEQHIKDLWKILTRAQDKKVAGSSLLALPKPYIVPGGRFTEVYYWDSYFTMLGLKEHGEIKTIENMVDNFAYLINTYGHIPNGNRSYYLSRSQPPFFAMMVNLLATIKGNSIYKKYLPALQKEYNFWMQGADTLKAGNAYKRVVRLNNGDILNRYCDDLSIPRQEGYKEDVKTADEAINKRMANIRFAGKEAMNSFIINNKKQVYNDLRSAAESGWDFSSRWFEDESNLTTIQTTSVIPIDLNCLLMVLEDVLIANGGKVNKKLAANRRDAINKYFWNEELNFYCDIMLNDGQSTGKITAAGLFPLATMALTGDEGFVNDRVDKIEATFRTHLLKPGGVVCSRVNNGQQWDAPNGWAPLQWMAIKGFDNYNKKDLAKDIAAKWTSLVEKVYQATGKLTEKYNVIDLSLETGGGEYPNLDGFGWTNGVYMALKNYLK